MLKCIHCEGEIVAEIVVGVPLNFKLNDDRELKDYDSLFEIEDDIKQYGDIEKYRCKCCGRWSKDLNDLIEEDNND